jgi:TolB-like protein
VIRAFAWLPALAAVAVFLACAPQPRAQSLQGGLEQLAANMAQRLVREGEGALHLVIADFPSLRGEYCGMGRFIAERLTTQLSATKGLRVVERSMLAQALLEMKLAQADLADAEKAKQLGLRIGAQALALGGLADLGNTVELDVRVIRLESGETLFAGFTSFAKSQGIDALMRQDCGRGAPPATAAGGAPAIEPQETVGQSERAQTGNEPRYENDAYRLSFEAVRKTGATISATVVVENIGAAPIKFALRNNSYLIDEHGDRWDQAGADSAALWAWGESFALADLIPGIKRRTHVQFKAAAPSSRGTVFTLVAKEYRPQEGRTLSLSGIRAERELAAPR